MSSTFRFISDSLFEGIAVSPADKRIFYTETTYNVVGAINYDGTEQQNIITTDLEYPCGIAVYPETR